MSVQPAPAPLPKIAAPAMAARRQNVVASETLMPETAPAKHDRSFSFWDLVDIVNPLQHIPIVNSIYREITGDQIGGVARVVGGALFGGFAGAAFGVLNAAVAENTGHDIGDTILISLTEDTPDAETAATTIVTTAQNPAANDAAPDSPVTAASIVWDDAVPPVGKRAIRETPVNHPAIPVIEVRPLPRQAAEIVSGPALPPARSLAELDKTRQPDVAAPPAPVAKAKVQQAMLDALLKMQSQRETTDPATDG